MKIKDLVYKILMVLLMAVAVTIIMAIIGAIMLLIGVGGSGPLGVGESGIVVQFLAMLGWFFIVGFLNPTGLISPLGLILGLFSGVFLIWGLVYLRNRLFYQKKK